LLLFLARSALEMQWNLISFVMDTAARWRQSAHPYQFSAISMSDTGADSDVKCA
jgi:hypothetical protein